MSSKWKSSRKVSVDGASFKRARLAAKSQDEGSKRGEYGHGSQEWLAEQARISPRTVNTLETGQATVKTVDAVSSVLAIKGREYIKGYGEDFTTFNTTGVVDFRPTVNGKRNGNETVYLDSAFLVTLDPIVITVDDDFIEVSKLQQMHLKISVGGVDISFKWLYNVRLTSRSTTWLGDEEDVSEVNLWTREPYSSSVMFRQESLTPVSWRSFIDHLKTTDDKRIIISLTLTLENFEKSGYILLSMEEVKNLLNSSSSNTYPYWIQPNALMA